MLLWLMVSCYVQEDLWLSAFPVGTEVCAHSQLHGYSDIATHSFSLAFNNIYNFLWNLQWENIDKIKEFNWNFENLEVYYC
jgi:hypothetical protein